MKEVSFWRRGGGGKCKTIRRIVRTSEKILATPLNPCGYWTSGTLSALASNGNTLYNVMGVKRHYASWSFWKWEYQWSWDKPYCLCCKQWCPMLQFGWEQICVEDVHFKTLSWSDRIFVVDWNIPYKQPRPQGFSLKKWVGPGKGPGIGWSRVLIKYSYQR